MADPRESRRFSRRFVLKATAYGGAGIGLAAAGFLAGRQTRESSIQAVKAEAKITPEKQLKQDLIRDMASFMEEHTTNGPLIVNFLTRSSADAVNNAFLFAEEEGYGKTLQLRLPEDSSDSYIYNPTISFTSNKTDPNLSEDYRAVRTNLNITGSVKLRNRTDEDYYSFGEETRRAAFGRFIHVPEFFMPDGWNTFDWLTPKGIVKMSTKVVSRDGLTRLGSVDEHLSAQLIVMKTPEPPQEAPSQFPPNWNMHT